MITHPYVESYLAEIEQHPERFNKERIKLAKYLREYVLTKTEYHFDEQLINDCVKWIETLFFKLEPFQKFIIAFIFLFNNKNQVVFDTFFITLARGGGKNGLISGLSSFFISGLHGVKNYHGVVVANSEKQAKTSFEEIYQMMFDHNLIYDIPSRSGLFDVKKSQIKSMETRSEFEFATSNVKTKDGGRQGFVIFDEVHIYEDSKLVDVFTSGLGKVLPPRRFFIGTNGFVREGFYDQLEEQANEILDTGDNPDYMFPFICKLDDASEVDDDSNWQKAQPMFAEPRSTYGEGLFETYKRAYRKLKTEPSSRPEFMTKRMNLPEINLEEDVASREEVLATNQPIPFNELKGSECIGGVDFGSIRDFTAVGLLFKKKGKLYWHTHSFARQEYLQKANLKPPIYEWAEKGLLTIVDEPSISPTHVVDWFKEQSKLYSITKIEIDSYKMDLIAPLLEEAGFEVEIIRRPSSIHPRLAPIVEKGFAERDIVWGDNPLMRWYTNNVMVKTLKDGGKQYLKKDEHRRKTDGFQAFLHALSRVNEIEESNAVENAAGLLAFLKGGG